MKALCLLLASALALCGADLTCRVEKGLNLLRTWQDGILNSESRQLLSDCTNLFQQEKVWSTSGVTQKISTGWYQGNGAMLMKDGWILEWMDNGTFSSNHLDDDLGIWSSFSSGGNQGAMTVQNGNGERTQIINAARLRTEWKTNGNFVSSCANNNDRATVILWYRTNAVSEGLPWFIGGQCSLEPGEKKIVRVPTPVDCIWHFMGTDKCFDCGEPCWLAGWPTNHSGDSSSMATLENGSLILSFTGAAGVSYALKTSFNLRDWRTERIIPASDSVLLQCPVPLDSASAFFRMEMVQTSTMTPEETAEALKEIREFNNQP